MTRKSASPTVTLDHPFLFFIRDNYRRKHLIRIAAEALRMRTALLMGR